MPTKNPKVSGYVPQYLKDRLIQFQKDNGGISESRALSIILAERFELGLELKEEVLVSGVSRSEFESLRAELDELTKKVDYLSEAKGSLLQSENSDNKEREPLQLRVEVDVSSDVVVPVSGYKLSELRFGLNKNTIAGAKKARSTEKFTEWTRQKDPDGIPWKYVETPSKGYVPASELSGELQVRLKEWIEENI